MISRLLPVIFLNLFSILNLVGQIDSNNISYKRLEGDTDSLSLKANVIQVAEKLSGNYELSAIDQETKTLEFDGFINENNMAVINQLGDSDPILKGVFVDDRFTGIWNPGKGDKDIELFESYPNGSIGLSIYYLRSETNLVGDNIDSPTAEIELTLLYPESSLNENFLISNIEQSIRSHFIDNEQTYSNPDSLLIHTEKRFYSMYKEQNQDWHDSGNSFDWLKETSMSVCYNSNYILCLEYLDYVYSGGAHGMTNLSYDILSLETGDKIEYTDIFIENSTRKLSEILTLQVRSDKQIPDSIHLSTAGYFVDSITPGKNIYVNGSGIGFIFNQYEIAPYSAGITNIFVRYEQLKELLKTDSPVLKIIR